MTDIVEEVVFFEEDPYEADKEDQERSAKRQKLNAELQKMKIREQSIQGELKTLQQQDAHRAKERAKDKGKQRWQEYQHADAGRKKEIYDVCLREFCNSNCCRQGRSDGAIKYGRLWDVLPCRYKIQKSTGNIYWTGKNAQGNIIRYPNP